MNELETALLSTLNQHGATVESARRALSTVGTVIHELKELEDDLLAGNEQFLVWRTATA
jgi:hypothetical protein